MHDDGAKSIHFFTVPVGVRMIATALEETRRFCAAAGIGDAGAKLAIIVEELLFNLVDHGAAPMGAPVTIEFSRADQGVRLVITDPGRFFDPRGAAPPGDLPPERGGGAGLALVAAWSRLEDYRRDGDRNRMALLIPLD